MSDFSVNDHLEGILSDFEALKRSFDIEDVDDIPTFSPTATLSSPFSPGPILNKTNEGRGQTTHISPSYQSRISIGSNPSPSPVMKNKMNTSLSFNRGTMAIAKTNGNMGPGITRVSSFQSKFNPNGFTSCSSPGSDNDSLHSSSSSLEYQASSKMSSYASPPQSPMGMSEYKALRLGSPALKKFSSHGNMFHSEVGPPLVIAAEPIGVNHVSMPSLDLHIAENRTIRSTVSPGLRYGNSGVSWGSSPQQPKPTGLVREPSFSSSHQPPKLRESVRLNKFPLDLDSLVSQPQETPVEPPPFIPMPPPRSNFKLSSLSSSASPSLSTNSLDSTDTGSTHEHIENTESMSAPESIPVPSVSESPVPLSPAQTPQLKLASQPQVVQLSPVSSPLPSQMGIVSDPEQEVATVKESVGSILQRIASFSRAEKPFPGPMENHYCNRVEKEVSPVQHQMFKKGEDVSQGLEPQVQMAETEAEPVEQLPCASGPTADGLIMGRSPFGYVGIEAVLDQMRRKAMKTGFEFNIMVVGQSGLGKSTLVNTLFKSKVSRKSCTPNYEEKISKTVNLQSISHVIEEKGVKMKLTVIDTPGFGDQINNENCWEPIVKYINEQYEKYLKEELNINRKRRIPDTRVHCCVYFLPPTGHWLRPLDVEFMKRLGKIVSIVPVIAKADTLTLEERHEFKQRIRHDLQANGIRVYPQKEYDEDAEDRILNDKIREKIPFAVVGTDKEHQVNGNKVLGRKTKWGIIEVENVAHCEFANLRDLLIRSHLQDLKDVTHNIHYEIYRVRRLNESNVNGLGLSPLTPVNGTVDKSDAESNL
ncbi:septin-9-like isoform X1 [Anguilla anguilla]|uniref:septin-9-like isoform X1 n=1 Tax=Anguilla anguilla TaxID=7936 RepID=UPI0015B1355E|nr:septin-9-like isoform X1 [Anguilla anguilla]